MSATRDVTCPDCGRVLTVRDEDERTVYCEVVGALPDECCQRAATERWSKVGKFYAKPKGDA